MRLSPDLQELMFRGLVSLIFVGLGFEHIFSDALIQVLMPTWVPEPRLVSILCGVILLSGGMSLLLGFAIRRGAQLLAAFLVVVTTTVHLPGLLHTPASIPSEWSWLWVVFQRSNFVKNLCLLGICIHLMRYTPGRHSLQAFLAARGRDLSHRPSAPTR